MTVIRAWLCKQASGGVDVSFLVNFNLTEDEHQLGRLLVYVDPVSKEAVGYQWGGLLAPGILEVRNDMRRHGIGRAMVEHRMVLAAAANEDVLYIQCKPASSIPFWKRMGFELFRAHGQDYGFCVLPRALQLPGGGHKVQVLVEWLPESAKWEPSTPPRVSQRTEGVRLDGKVFLAERASCFRKIPQDDMVVRIAVDDSVLYCDKAKYERARLAGLRLSENGYYIDVLSSA
jgi:GNAT superfamily N-acetyltransferase